MTLPDTPGRYGPAYLRGRAQEYRRMAETATNEETADGLLRVAERFEALAAQIEEGDSP
jgi:hypothetical protein